MKRKLSKIYTELKLELPFLSDLDALIYSRKILNEYKRSELDLIPETISNSTNSILATDDAFKNPWKIWEIEKDILPNQFDDEYSNFCNKEQMAISLMEAA